MNARLSIGRILIACFAAAPLLLSGCGGSRAPEPANDAAPAATAPAPASSPTRTWADAGGKFQIEAVFVAAEPDRDIVRLKRADGSPFIAPLSRLSAADKQYLAAAGVVLDRTAPPPGPAAAAGDLTAPSPVPLQDLAAAEPAASAAASSTPAVQALVLVSVQIAGNRLVLPGLVWQRKGDRAIVLVAAMPFLRLNYPKPATTIGEYSFTVSAPPPAPARPVPAKIAAGRDPCFWLLSAPAADLPKPLDFDPAAEAVNGAKVRIEGFALASSTEAVDFKLVAHEGYVVPPDVARPRQPRGEIGGVAPETIGFGVVSQAGRHVAVVTALLNPPPRLPINGPGMASQPPPKPAEPAIVACPVQQLWTTFEPQASFLLACLGGEDSREYEVAAFVEDPLGRLDHPQVVLLDDQVRDRPKMDAAMAFQPPPPEPDRPQKMKGNIVELPLERAEPSAEIAEQIKRVGDRNRFGTEEIWTARYRAPKTPNRGTHSFWLQLKFNGPDGGPLFQREQGITLYPSSR